MLPWELSIKMRRPWGGLLRALSGLMLLLWLTGCEKSPIGTSRIQPDNFLQLEGQIGLSAEDSPAGVYVWLEGTPIRTHTDERGRFSIQLSRVTNADLPLRGAFRLFFFVANYRIDFANVLIQDGKFLYNRGDVDARGRITRPKQLKKLLSVKVAVSPEAVNEDVQQLIQIRLALAAIDDSVTVIFPKMAGSFLGAVLFHHLDTDSVYAEISDIDFQNAITLKIGQEEQEWIVQIDYLPGMFPIGRYRVVPYFLIQQEDLPSGLLESIDARVSQFGPAYLKYPLKRREAILEIRPGQ